MGSNVTILDREMYSEAEASRLLGLSQSTLHYWLEGGERRGKTYPPVIRERKLGVRTVKWAEFVEAALLREYRHRNVPMIELRTFIDTLRTKFNVPYPLAHQAPFVSGKSLIYAAQEEIGLSADFALVAVANDQFLLTPPSHSFLERVTWADDLAAEWRPHSDPKSPVRMSPDIRFGRPAVAGISTAAVWEQSESGADEHEIADIYGLSVSDVRWALAYEQSQRAA